MPQSPLPPVYTPRVPCPVDRSTYPVPRRRGGGGGRQEPLTTRPRRDCFSEVLLGDAVCRGRTDRSVVVAAAPALVAGAARAGAPAHRVGGAVAALAEGGRGGDGALGVVGPAPSAATGCQPGHHDRSTHQLSGIGPPTNWASSCRFCRGCCCHALVGSASTRYDSHDECSPILCS